MSDALEAIEAVRDALLMCTLPQGAPFHDLAAKLTEALSDLRAREEFVVKAETCFGRVEDELDYTDEFNAAHRAYTAWRRGLKDE